MLSLILNIPVCILAQQSDLASRPRSSQAKSHCEPASRVPMRTDCASRHQPSDLALYRQYYIIVDHLILLEDDQRLQILSTTRSNVEEAKTGATSCGELHVYFACFPDFCLAKPRQPSNIRVPSLLITNSDTRFYLSSESNRVSGKS